ncbi:MAG: hypothetical protein IJ493_06960 [Clostridia bacterium]|nr:hypothetical protein [Clostridia bacterium]
MSAPRLLNYESTPLPARLFDDLQAGTILSPAAIGVLRHPCGRNEILRRQELFAAMTREDCRARITASLDLLKACRRTLELWREANDRLERQALFLRLLACYPDACESIGALSGFGSLCDETAAYFASPEKRQLYDEMRADRNRAAALSAPMRKFLLSVSDKYWLTPDAAVRDEFDEIAARASGLGFAIPEKKAIAARADRSLSDGVCRLFAAQVSGLDAIAAKYAEIDWNEPVGYIGELEFFLEIHALCKRAEACGIPHCFPTPVEKRRYIARDVCDITLISRKSSGIVPNDVHFTEEEPFFFLTGANGGGKTTYLRAVGINLALFLAGCPIFATQAAIYPFGTLLSHFPADEGFADVGRLDDERRRADEMLASAGECAFLLFNETYSGTDDKRGFTLMMETADAVRQVGHFCLYVTHFHPAADSGYPILTALVDAADGNRRTWRIARKNGRTSSFAADILRKYKLDRESLMERRCGHGDQSSLS